jgi:hypothetical protein
MKNKTVKSKVAAAVVTEPTKKSTSAKVETKGKLGAILGHSVVSVIRAWGKAGWSVQEAQLALSALKIEAAPHTIKGGLLRGRQADGTRRIAELTKAELDSLHVAVPKAKKSTKE